MSQFYGTPAREAQSSYYQAADHRAMTNDFMSGDPNLIQGVLNHWATGGINANPLTQQRHQQAFAKMAELAPAMLEKINPQAYEKMLMGNTQKIADFLYNESRCSRTTREDFKRAQGIRLGRDGPSTKKNSPLRTLPGAAADQRTGIQSNAKLRPISADVNNFNLNGLEGGKNPQTGEYPAGTEIRRTVEVNRYPPGKG